MPGFSQNRNIVIAVLLVAFVSVLFLWHRSGSNLQDNPEDIELNYFPQHWPSISQTKYAQFKEYVFPSAVKGESTVSRL